jgi:hypothetical protein
VPFARSRGAGWVARGRGHACRHRPASPAAGCRGAPR